LEGILAGGSSGAAVMAVERMRDRIPAGANCVVVFPDRGERYLDTIYSDDWVTAHFGPLAPPRNRSRGPRLESDSLAELGGVAPPPRFTDELSLQAALD
jgi:hypothetical protein